MLQFDPYMNIILFAYSLKYTKTFYKKIVKITYIPQSLNPLWVAMEIMNFHISQTG